MVSRGKEELNGGGGARSRKSDRIDNGRNRREGGRGYGRDKGKDACGGFQLVEGGGSSLDGVPGGAACGGEHVAGGGSDPQGGERTTVTLASWKLFES